MRQKAGRHKHPTGGCLDSQSIKTTAVPGERGYDAAKKVVGRKRHILVDTMGLLLCVVVTAACVSESAGARLVLSRMPGGCKKLRKVWVDGGYFGTCWSGRSCSSACCSKWSSDRQSRKALLFCRAVGSSNAPLLGCRLIVGCPKTMNAFLKPVRLSFTSP